MTLLLGYLRQSKLDSANNMSELELKRHILLEEINQLPEQIKEQVNMTAVIGMIAVEQVSKSAKGDAEKCYVCEQRATAYERYLAEFPLGDSRD